MITITGNLGKQRAGHLLSRLSVARNGVADLDTFESLDITSAHALIFSKQTHPLYTGDAFNGQAISEWDLGVSEKTDPSWFGRMTFFLHSCLPAGRTFGFGPPRPNFFQLIHWGVSQSYKDLIKKVTIDQLMGNCLNLNVNVKGTAPNENYARELLELFTLGKGPQISEGNYTTYTEQDIKEAARLLTGWRYQGDFNDPALFDPDLGWTVMKPAATKHDDGDKTFSAAFQNTTIVGSDAATELDQFIELIFAQPAVDQFIMTKLYRYYVSDKLDQSIIDQMATTWRANNFKFQPVLEELTSSEHFYRSQHIGSKIMSPVEIYYKTHNLLNGSIDRTVLMRENAESYLKNMGQEFREPPGISGYLANFQEPLWNRNWLSPSTLTFRFKYMNDAIQSADLSALLAAWEDDDPNVVIANAMAYLVGGYDPDTLTSAADIYKDQMLGGGAEIHWIDGTPTERADMFLLLISSIVRSFPYQVF